MFRGEGCKMVGRFWECLGLVIVGSVRRGLTSSRHSATTGTIILSQVLHRPHRLST